MWRFCYQSRKYGPSPGFWPSWDFHYLLLLAHHPGKNHPVFYPLFRRSENLDDPAVTGGQASSRQLDSPSGLKNLQSVVEPCWHFKSKLGFCNWVWGDLGGYQGWFKLLQWNNRYCYLMPSHSWIGRPFPAAFQPSLLLPFASLTSGWRLWAGPRIRFPLEAIHPSCGDAVVQGTWVVARSEGMDFAWGKSLGLFAGGVGNLGWMSWAIM